MSRSISVEARAALGTLPPEAWHSIYAEALLDEILMLQGNCNEVVRSMEALLAYSRATRVAVDQYANEEWDGIATALVETTAGDRLATAICVAGREMIEKLDAANKEKDTLENLLKMSIAMFKARKSGKLVDFKKPEEPS